MANEQMYSDPRLYSDANGRGAVINQPIATPEVAMANMKTRRPGGGAYVQLPGGPGNMINNAQSNEEVDIETDEQPVDMDYLESLFNGENLSEEFMHKAAVIFEAAINEKISIVEQSILEAAKEIIQEQEEAAKEIIEEQIAANNEYLTEQLDNYLSYVITEWAEENKVAIERGLRTEIAEHFMVGLKNLLDETFIDVPEDKYDVLDEMANANENLQNQLNEEIKKNIELSNEITARLCAEAFIDISEDLTDTEVEKLSTLAEGIEFSSVEQYAEKVKLLKESYFGNGSSTIDMQQNLTEESTHQARSNSPQMNALVEAMSRMNKHTVKQQPKIDQNSNAGKLLNLINTNMTTDQYI